MRKHFHFFLLGNGGGGTTLTQKMLDAHEQIECLFENKGNDKQGEPDEEIKVWRSLATQAEEKGLIWGNKEPIEQFKTRKYSDEQVTRLADEFKIIWLTRRFSRYHKPKRPRGHTLASYKENWDWGRSLYWLMKEAHPATVLQVSWEDLLLRPRTELMRMCDFLGVGFDKRMICEPINVGKV